MELGKAFGVPGSGKGPPGLVIVPGVIFSPQSAASVSAGIRQSMGCHQGCALTRRVGPSETWMRWAAHVQKG